MRAALLLIFPFTLLPSSPLTPALASREEARDERGEVFGVERLDDEVAAADRARGGAELGRVECGDGDDGHVARALVLAYAERRREAVEHGHVQVHQDEVQPAALRALYRLLPA